MQANIKIQDHMLGNNELHILVEGWSHIYLQSSYLKYTGMMKPGMKVYEG